MVKQTIKIFCRAKPTRLKTGILSIEEDETLRRSTIEFVVPKDLASGFINNKKESYKFSFEKVFDQQTKQDEIFEHVAKDVVDNVLSGYNGTIFAYGQTGSGKTFTITGGAEKYADRGIIPRVLAYLFEKFELDKDHIYTTEISYLEIYNENGYDLLDPRHEADKLENLPKVVLMEDTDQCIHLKNLTILPSQSIEEALNLLFLGDTNRMIAETPMNQASTRSHCIFTIHITSREPGSATIRRSKLHLVDLAGSERVTKTQVGGQLLTEAKYINLSLHFLEQVIVALGEKNRQHVPYRNSMMTSVLRDSLGGNCMTTMIATIAVDKKNVDESISTCRFSQRVALIKNEATLNEELDPKLMIVRLKKEVQSLKDELSLVTGEERSDTLTQEEMDHLNEIIQHYLKDSDLETTLEVGSDMRKIQYCYQVLKQNIKSKDRNPAHAKDEIPDPLNSQRTTPRPMTGSGDSMETKRLKEILEQRDNEINILVSMLKKERKRALNAEAQLQKSDMSRVGSNTAPNNHTASTEYNSFAYDSDQAYNNGTPPKSRLKDPQLSAGRQEAFEVFKENYEHNDTVIDKKELLKQRYAEAKSLGLQVNEARNMMNKLKADVEKMRKQRAVQATMNDSTEDSFEENEREAVIRQQMEDIKTRYKQSFTKLKAMKTEIDHLHHLLDKARVQMQKDFDSWWNQQSKRNNARPPSGYSRPSSVQEKHNDIMSFQTKVPLPPHSLRTNEAWRTPPESPNKVIDGKTSGRVKHRPGSTSAINPSLPVEHRTSEINEKNDYRKRHNVTTQESNGHSANFIPKMAMNFRNNDTITDRYSNTSASHSAPTTHAPDSISRYPLRSLSGGPEGVLSTSERKIPFTGDSKTDANILAFIKARESLMQKNNSVA